MHGKAKQRNNQPVHANTQPWESRAKKQSVCACYTQAWQDKAEEQSADALERPKLGKAKQRSNQP
eukprot:10012174-Alexandrium_andersonii.AAC.1